MPRHLAALHAPQEDGCRSELLFVLRNMPDLHICYGGAMSLKKSGCTAPPLPRLPAPSVSQSSPRSIASVSRCVASTTATACKKMQRREKERERERARVDHVKCCQPVRLSEVDQRKTRKHQVQIQPVPARDVYGCLGQVKK